MSETEQVQEKRQGNIWRRIAAFLVDTIIIGGGLYLIIFAFGRAWEATFPLEKIGSTSEALWAFLLAVALPWLYFALMESSEFQGTLGKMLFGIRVADRQGEPIGFWRASIRYLAKLLSTVILFIGYLLAVFSKQEKSLHDRIAGTRVLRK